MTSAVNNYTRALLVSGYTWDGKKHYGIGPVVEHTQVLVGQIPERISHGVTVRRNGKDVPWVQDTADGTSAALRAEAKIDALTALVTKFISSPTQAISKEEVTNIINRAVEQSTAAVAARKFELEVNVVEKPAIETPPANAQLPALEDLGERP